MILEDAVRVAAAIVFESLALVIWNLGSRTPRQLIEDGRKSLSSARRFTTAALVTILGAIFFLTAVVLLFPTFTNPPVEFSPVVIGTALVALVVDALVGGELRALVFTRRSP